MKPHNTFLFIFNQPICVLPKNLGGECAKDVSKKSGFYTEDGAQSENDDARRCRRFGDILENET